MHVSDKQVEETNEMAESQLPSGTEAELRNALDQTIQQIIKKMDRKSFVESFPENISRELLTSFHGRLQEIIKPKLSEKIEDILESYNVIEKLAELDKMKSSSQHPRRHHAWRPATGETGVDQSLAAHDYSVATREKTELEAMLGQLEADNTELEDRIAESTAVMNRNMEAIGKRNECLNNVASKLNQ